MPPTCAANASRKPTMTATKKRVRIASANGVPLGGGGISPASRRMPSGAHPSASGSARTRNQATGTMPTTNSAPSHGVPAASPRLSSNCLANGVITMPPTDNPVDATDRRDRSLEVEPPRDDRGRRDQPRCGPPGSEHGVDDEQLPLLFDLAEHAEREPTDQSPADDHQSHVVAGDPPCNPHAEHTTDDEEDGGRERDRAQRPIALLAERVEIDRQPVEAEPRRHGEHRETPGDHPPARESAHAGPPTSRVLRAPTRAIASKLRRRRRTRAIRASPMLPRRAMHHVRPSTA